VNPYLNGYAGAYFPVVLAGWLSFFIIPIVIWSLFWQAVALWRAARNNSKIWFVVLLLVHTLGILDMLYIFVFSKTGGKRKTSPGKKN
jgi:hypothetical protein